MFTNNSHKVNVLKLCWLLVYSHKLAIGLLNASLKIYFFKSCDLKYIKKEECSFDAPA